MGRREGRRRVDLQTASELLGISSDAVRKRAKRGNMPYETGADGKLYVWVDSEETETDTPGAGPVEDVPPPDPGPDYRDELISTLKEQLEAERNAHAETRRIAYTLAQRVPELEAAQESREAQVSPTGDDPEETERAEVQDRPEGSQEAAERRSWWRRFFGFE